MANNIRALSRKLIEDMLQDVCSLNSGVRRSPLLRSRSSFQHPLEQVSIALALHYMGETREAMNIQKGVVSAFRNCIGSTSDEYLDLAGAMNDLGAYHSCIGDFEASENILKRALMMSERSYRTNNDLQLSLLSNLAELYRYEMSTSP